MQIYGPNLIMDVLFSSYANKLLPDILIRALNLFFVHQSDIRVPECFSVLAHKENKESNIKYS